ncbi:MAG: hypothetical protein ACO1SV_14245 [Fimbriimonas sp.]
MKSKPLCAVPLLVGILAIGCAPSEGDTAPLPPKDPQARVQQAQKGVEASNMTPEQKRAAADYLGRGAEGARKMKESAGATGR